MRWRTRDSDNKGEVEIKFPSRGWHPQSVGLVKGTHKSSRFLLFQNGKERKQKKISIFRYPGEKTFLIANLLYSTLKEVQRTMMKKLIRGRGRSEPKIKAGARDRQLWERESLFSLVYPQCPRFSTQKALSSSSSPQRTRKINYSDAVSFPSLVFAQNECLECFRIPPLKGASVFLFRKSWESNTIWRQHSVAFTKKEGKKWVWIWKAIIPARLRYHHFGFLFPDLGAKGKQRCFFLSLLDGAKRGKRKKGAAKNARNGNHKLSRMKNPKRNNSYLIGTFFFSERKDEKKISRKKG